MIDTDSYELTEEELQLKSLYLKHPELQRKEPFYQPELTSLCCHYGFSLEQFGSHPLLENLSENDCVNAGFDVSVLRCPRYLPALYHTHPAFEMIFVWSGQCTHFINDTAPHMKAGDLCLVAPMTCHALSLCSDDAAVYHFFLRRSTFERTFLDLSDGQDVLSDFFVQGTYAINRNSVLFFSTETDEILRSFIRYSCQESSEQARYSSRMLNHLVRAIFLLVLRNHESKAKYPLPPDKAANKNLISILNYIQTNFTHLTLLELAQAFNYSERHMSRLLKEQTGMNFHDLLRKSRIEKAAALLSHPDISLSDIMERVGYSDISSFSRAFKAYFSMTPAEYRKQKLCGTNPLPR